MSYVPTEEQLAAMHEAMSWESRRRADFNKSREEGTKEASASKEPVEKKPNAADKPKTAVKFAGGHGALGPI